MFIGALKSSYILLEIVEGHVRMQERAHAQEIHQKALPNLSSLVDPEALHKQKVRVKSELPHNLLAKG